MKISHEEIKDLFSNQRIPVNSFTRISTDYYLDFYLGFDEGNSPTLLLVCDREPVVDLVPSLIDVRTSKRQDGRWALSFVLLDKKLLDLFSWFCLDLISSSANIKDGIQGVRYISERYKKWQKMLTKTRGRILSENEIKGLIGELFFLKNYLIPQYGEETAIKSWIGPIYANQDFACEDSWYEIKTTSSGSNRIKISSIAQLDDSKEGTLIAIFLDKTSLTNNQCLNLNSYIQTIKEDLKDEYLVSKFEELIVLSGYYPSKEYEKYSFKYVGAKFYNVDYSFPCIREKDLPTSVKNVKYDLILSEIESWRNCDARFREF